MKNVKEAHFIIHFCFAVVLKSYFQKYFCFHYYRQFVC